MISKRQAYTKWLGLKEHSLPPNFYRLLGVEEFETDLDIISNAADARMAYLRHFHAGENAAVVAELLNELAQARVTLLSAEKKAAYDVTLRGRQAPPVRGANRGVPPAKRVGASVVPVARLVHEAEVQAVDAPAPYVCIDVRRQRTRRFPVLATVISALALAGMAAVATYAFYHGAGRELAMGPVADADEPAQETPAPLTPTTPENSLPEPPPPIPESAPAPVPPVPKPPEPQPPLSPKPPAPPPLTPPPTPVISTPDVEPPPAPAKPAPPDDAAQQESMKLVTEVYRAEQSVAKTPEAKRQLAQKMIGAARQAKDPVERYVLLRVARDVAIQAGEGHLAFQIIDQLDQGWEIDAAAEQARAVDAAAAAAQTPAQQEAIVVLATDLQGDALELDDFGQAAHLGELALRASRAARNGGLTKLLQTRNEQLAAIIAHFEQVEPALATLKQSPGDAAGNLAAGRYYALVKGDWDEGLELLSQGADEGLKQVAVLELADQHDPLRLGDAWWTAAEKETDALCKRNCVDRARTWYTTAISKTAGLQKALVERRLREAAETLAGAACPLLSPEADRAINEHLTKPAGGSQNVAKKVRDAKRAPTESDEAARRRLASKLNVQKRQQMIGTINQRQAEKNAAMQSFRNKYDVRKP